MASVFKRSGSSYWHYRIREDGKDRWVCTWEKSRKQAQEIADNHAAAARGKMHLAELFTHLARGILDLPSDEQKRVRCDFGRALLHESANTLRLAESWQAWVDSPMKRDPAPATVAGYQGYWTRFETWAKGQALTYMHDVTARHAQDYAGNLWAGGISPRTYNGHLKFLRSMFKALRVKAGLVDNPWQDIPAKPNETQSREAFTVDELRAICAKAAGEYRAMIGVGLYTGLRLGDVVNLEWESVKADRIEVTPGKTRRLRKRLAVPLHPVLAGLLAERRSAVGHGERYVLPEQHALHVQSRTEVSKRFQRFLVDCGVKTTAPAEGHRKLPVARKSFHSLRHSFVSLCAASGVPQHVTQALVGHGSPAMTEHYTHVDEGQKRQSIAALPEIGFAQSTKETP